MAVPNRRTVLFLAAVIASTAIADPPYPDTGAEPSDFAKSLRAGPTEDVAPAARVANTADAGTPYPDTGTEPSDFAKSLRAGPADEPTPAARVGGLGDPATIEFTGVKSFEVQEIRNALAIDPLFQAAARPSAELQKFLAVLEDRLIEGFANAAIDGKIDVSLAGEPLRVVVACQNLRGPYRFDGFQVADGDAHLPLGILERIQGEATRGWRYRLAAGKEISGTNRNDWQADNPAPMDTESRGRAMTHTAACYLDFGLMPLDRVSRLEKRESDSRIAAVLTSDPERVTRGIKIAPIEINGLTRHTREEVLELIGVAEGDPLHHTTLQRVCDRLETCRAFWRHRVDVVLPAPPGRYEEPSTDARLVVTLVECDRLPKLGESFSEHDQAMLRFADWVGRLDEADEDLVFDFTGEKLQASLVVSPKSGRVMLEARGVSPWGDWTELKLNHTLIVEPGNLTVIDWRRAERAVWNVPQIGKINLAIKATTDQQGKPSGSFQLGYGSTSEGPEKPWKLNIDPLAILRMGWRSEKRLSGGVLILQSERGVVRIDAESGMPIDGGITLPDGVSVAFATREGEYEGRAALALERAESLPNRIKQAAPVASAAAFLIDQFIAQTAASDNEETRRLAASVGQALETAELDRWLAEVFGSSEETDKSDSRSFAIPTPAELAALCDQEQQDDEYLVWFPVLADRAFARGSWPWTLMREWALLEVAVELEDTQPVAREFERLMRGKKNGPLFALIAAPCFERYGNASVTIAREGLTRINEEALRRDLAHFTEGDLLGAELVAKLSEVATLINDDQRGVVLRFTPEIAQPPMAWFLERRRDLPHEPPREAVVAAVVAAWNNGWREQVEAYLSGIAESQP